MIIDLMRHGSPQGGKMYRGNSVDHPLSEAGWEQMWQQVGHYDKWELIVTSPMIRCLDFATALGEKIHVPVRVYSDLKEVGFGAWEGKTREEIDPQEYQNFYADPVHHRPLGAEDLEHFMERVVNRFDKIIRQHQGKHLLIITHAGVIRALLTHVLDAPPHCMYQFDIHTAAISRIKLTQRSGWVVDGVNLGYFS